MTPATRRALIWSRCRTFSPPPAALPLRRLHTSKDGTRWKIDHKHAAFAAAAGKTAFDSRYTSTPCVLRLKNRYLLYYSARDWKTEYIDAQGRKRTDKASPYAHIGVAEIRKPRFNR